MSASRLPHCEARQPLAPVRNRRLGCIDLHRWVATEMAARYGAETTVDGFDFGVAAGVPLLIRGSLDSG
jgi:hypothetical protein